MCVSLILVLLCFRLLRGVGLVCLWIGWIVLLLLLGGLFTFGGLLGVCLFVVF